MSALAAVGRSLALGLTLLAALAVAAAGHAQTESLYHTERGAMGTTFEAFLYASDGERAAELFELAFEEIERVEALLSIYRPESELSRLNATADAAAVRTDPELFSFLEQSLVLSRDTEGAFDLTVGRLMEAWGFFRGAGRLPTKRELTVARARTGWQQVELDTAETTVRFLVPGLKLDPGGIGKGYALDRVAQRLHEHGVRAALIGSGTSSYYALGTPPGESGWAVRVLDPANRNRTLCTVFLRDQGLSTSGGAENYFDLEGRRFSHIMDPRTGWPAEGITQVTAIAPDATFADALSTAAFVLGAEAGARLLEQLPAGAALFVEEAERGGRVLKARWPPCR